MASNRLHASIASVIQPLMPADALPAIDTSLLDARGLAYRGDLRAQAQHNTSAGWAATLYDHHGHAAYQVAQQAARSKREALAIIKGWGVPCA